MLKEDIKIVHSWIGDWWYFYTPGQGMDNPVRVPWEIFEKIERIINKLNRDTAIENHLGEGI